MPSPARATGLATSRRHAAATGSALRGRVTGALTASTVAISAGVASATWEARS